MSLPSTDRVESEEFGQGSRLESWKEIASHLRRGERTVKRWESDRGMPVHRVPGGGRRSVYAYSAELNEWLKSSPSVDDDQDETSRKQEAGNASAHEAGVNSVFASDSISAYSPPAQPSTFRSSPRGRWVFALAGLALAAIAGAAVQVAALRHHGLPVSRKVFPMLAKSDPKHPNNAPVVSESEQQLSRDLYLKGRYQWSQRTPESLNRALDSFTQSIVHNPGYAPAYVGLADTYDLLREYSTMQDSDAYSRAIAAASTAVALDDNLSEAHRALAFAKFWGNWDFVGADKEYRRAIELNPKDPTARRWYANSFAVPGQIAACLKQMDKAEELDPSSPATLADKGLMLYNAGSTDEALELLAEVERNNPEFRSVHVYLMMIDLNLRRYPAFLTEGQKTAEIGGDPVLNETIASARDGYMQSGGRGLLKNLHAKQREYYTAGKLPGTELARTCVLMGRRKEALDLLEDGYKRHEPLVLVSLLERDLLVLDNEPRFQALTKKINFPASIVSSPGPSLEAEQPSPKGLP